MHYTTIDSPIGPLLVAGDEEGIRLISFEKNEKTRIPEDWKEDPAPLRDAIRQLNAYFSGQLKEFELRLAPQGTRFQRRVWQEMANIPYGETISYGDLARRIARPKASRAVGAASGRNPLPIVIPCHRVVGSTGKLTGYGGGLEVKEALLSLEQSRSQRRAKQASLL